MLTKIQGLLSYQWYKPTNETFHKAYLKIAATIIMSRTLPYGLMTHFGTFQCEMLT